MNQLSEIYEAPEDEIPELDKERLAKLRELRKDLDEAQWGDFLRKEAFKNDETT